MQTFKAVHQDLIALKKACIEVLSIAPIEYYPRIKVKIIDINRKITISYQSIKTIYSLFKPEGKTNEN